MSPLEELKLTSEKLCNTIDESIKNEKFFCDNITFEIDQMIWEMERMTNDIKSINQYIGI